MEQVGYEKVHDRSLLEKMLLELKIHVHFETELAMEPILSQLYSFSIIFPSIHKSSKWCLLFGLLAEIVYAFLSMCASTVIP